MDNKKSTVQPGFFCKKIPVNPSLVQRTVHRYWPSVYTWLVLACDSGMNSSLRCTTTQTHTGLTCGEHYKIFHWLFINSRDYIGYIRYVKTCLGTLYRTRSQIGFGLLSSSIFTTCLYHRVSSNKIRMSFISVETVPKVGTNDQIFSTKPSGRSFCQLI